MPRNPVESDANVVHNCTAFGAEQCRKRPLAKLVAQRRAENRAKCIGNIIFGPRRNYHFQRVDDAKAGERIDIQAQLVGRQHLLALHVNIAHALVDPYDLFEPGNDGDKACTRPPELFASLVTVDRPHRLTKAQHDALLGFGHDVKSAGDQEDQCNRRKAKEDRIAQQARPVEVHCPAPAWAAGGVTDARGPCSGR